MPQPGAVLRSRAGQAQEMEMDTVTQMVDRANAVIAEAPPPSDEACAARDMLVLAGMYRQATARAELAEAAYARLAAQLAKAEAAEVDRARVCLRDAEAMRLIQAAVDLMTPEQVGAWAGVANWIESADGDGCLSEFERLAELGRRVEAMPSGSCLIRMARCGWCHVSNVFALPETSAWTVECDTPLDALEAAGIGEAESK